MNNNIYDQLFENLEQLCNLSEYTLIAGDFNIHELQNMVATTRYLIIASNDIICDVKHDDNSLVPEDSHHPSLIVELSMKYKKNK